MPDQVGGSLAAITADSPGSGEERKGQKDAMQVRDPEMWQRLLWIRDQLRSRQNVLVFGQHLAPLLVLLLREGIHVTAFDSHVDAQVDMDMALAEEGIEADRLQLHAQDRQSDGPSLVPGSYDGAVILEGHHSNLETLLPSIAMATGVGARLVIVIPFGLQGGRSSGTAFPRVIADALGDGWSGEIDVAGSVIRATVIRDAAAYGLVSAAELLSMTESGAAEQAECLAWRARTAEHELEEVREALLESERHVRELQESTSFRLGLALVTALRSPASMAKLPLKLVGVLRSRKTRLNPVLTAKRTGLTEWEKEALRNCARRELDGGSIPVIEAVQAYLPDASPSLLGFAYLIAAQACGVAGRHDVEFEVATRALELNRSIGVLRGYLHVALRCREMQAASDTLKELHAAERAGNKIAAKFLREFRRTSSYKLAVLEAIPPRPERWSAVEDGRFVYVLHNSLPYSSGGYATRSHGVAVGLTAKGYSTVCLTRPGFPLDIRPDLAPIDVPVVDLIDGVAYQRVHEPSRLNVPEFSYVLAAAQRLHQEVSRLRPAYVQAASNYVTALPALVAARSMGVPFFYEVRGLWEITRMSRDQIFAESISFDVQRHIEATVAREADHVFTLTESLREELVERGVDPARITLLPNSVDATRFEPKDRDADLAGHLDIPEGVPVIGYVGTFVIYEGLEHLAEACVHLHRRGHDFRLLLVGNENASGQERGQITEEILRIAREGGIGSKLILAGRIPHEQVESYYSLIDICPFPRKPWPVCEMVSPMKPLEALAMKKAVVVSSVRALTEMIEDGVTGAVFEKGNTDSLAEVLEGLMLDPAKRARLGEAGREWVVRERAWTQVADRIDGVVQQFEALRKAADADTAVVD